MFPIWLNAILLLVAATPLPRIVAGQLAFSAVEDGNKRDALLGKKLQHVAALLDSYELKFCDGLPLHTAGSHNVFRRSLSGHRDEFVKLVESTSERPLSIKVYLDFLCTPATGNIPTKSQKLLCDMKLKLRFLAEVESIRLKRLQLSNTGIPNLLQPAVATDLEKTVSWLCIMYENSNLDGFLDRFSEWENELCNTGSSLAAFYEAITREMERELQDVAVEKFALMIVEVLQDANELNSIFASASEHLKRSVAESDGSLFSWLIQASGSGRQPDYHTELCSRCFYGTNLLLDYQIYPMDYLVGSAPDVPKTGHFAIVWRHWNSLSLAVSSKRYMEMRFSAECDTANQILLEDGNLAELFKALVTAGSIYEQLKVAASMQEIDRAKSNPAKLLGADVTVQLLLGRFHRELENFVRLTEEERTPAISVMREYLAVCLTVESRQLSLWTVVEKYRNETLWSYVRSADNTFTICGYIVRRLGAGIAPVSGMFPVKPSRWSDVRPLLDGFHMGFLDGKPILLDKSHCITKCLDNASLKSKLFDFIENHGVDLPHYLRMLSDWNFVKRVPELTELAKRKTMACSRLNLVWTLGQSLKKLRFISGYISISRNVVADAASFLQEANLWRGYVAKGISHRTITFNDENLIRLSQLFERADRSAQIQECMVLAVEDSRRVLEYIKSEFNYMQQLGEVVSIQRDFLNAICSEELLRASQNWSKAVASQGPLNKPETI